MILSVANYVAVASRTEYGHWSEYRQTCEKKNEFDLEGQQFSDDDDRSLACEVAKKTHFYWTSSFTYTVVGIVMLLYAQVLDRKMGNWPWRPESILLIFQSLWSYMNDVHFFGQSKLWRRVDVAFAGTLGLCQPTKVLVLSLDVFQAVIVIAGVLTGVYCLVRSKRCDKKLGRLKDFFFWHTAWHYSFPSAGILFILYSSLLPDRLLSNEISQFPAD